MIMIPPGVPGVMRGGNFFTDAGRWLRGAANSVGHFVKDNHVLSTAAGLIPHPAGAFGSAVLRQAGLGKPPRKGKGRMKFN
jgi:hypothetical protein